MQTQYVVDKRDNRSNRHVIIKSAFEYMQPGHVRLMRDEDNECTY